MYSECIVCPTRLRRAHARSGLAVDCHSVLKLTFLLTFVLTAAAKGPLVVVSVDGLDYRYLANSGRMGLKIPNIRKLMREGQTAAGVTGAFPTVTWPSHTTMITGADPVKHGILANWRPPGDRYLDYSQIRVPSLIGAAHDAGLKVATIDWPVTLNAPVDWNLPEYFEKRRGGGMDTRSACAKARPANLCEQIAADFPSFLQSWRDDRTRTQAAVWMLRQGKPDLLLLHLVDLDSEQHDAAPFTPEARAVIEYTDELIGRIVTALPAGATFALVSDHGFERIDTSVNLETAAAALGVTNLQQRGGIVVAPDSKAAAALRQLAADAKYGIGREVPRTELERFPSGIETGDGAVFESAEGFLFSPRGPEFSKPAEIGTHGHWPTRYRAVFVLWGPGVRHEGLPEISMKDIAGRLARVLEIRPPTPDGNLR